MPDNNVVHVSGLSSTATEELLSNFFTFHGKIEGITINGDSAHIQFGSASAAKSALLFDKASFLGQVIAVQLSDAPMPRTATKLQPPAPLPAPRPRVDSPTAAIDEAPVTTSARLSTESYAPAAARAARETGAAASVASTTPIDLNAAPEREANVATTDAHGKEGAAVPGAGRGEEEEAFERVERAPHLFSLFPPTRPPSPLRPSLALPSPLIWPEPPTRSPAPLAGTARALPTRHQPRGSVQREACVLIRTHALPGWQTPSSRAWATPRAARTQARAKRAACQVLPSRAASTASPP